MRTSNPPRYKSKYSPVLIMHHALKTCKEVDVCLHAFINTVIVGGELSVSRTGYVTARETASDTEFV